MALNRDGDRRGSNNSGASKNKSNENTSSARFLSPIGRMSFQHLFEPEDTDTGPKFNVTLLFPPGTDLRDLKDLLFDAMEAKFGKSDKWPRGARTPSEVFGDCGEKDYAGYKDGWTYIKFSSKDAPGIVDAARNAVDDKREVYNGRWARVSGTAYAYENKSKGCAFGLNNIQLLQHDDTFSGRPRAEDEFDDKYKDEVEASNNRRSGRGDNDRGRDRDGDDRGRGRDDRDDRDRDRGRGRDDDRSGRDRDGGDRGAGRGRDDRDSRDDRGSDRGRDRDRGRDDDRAGSDRGGRDRDAGRGRDDAGDDRGGRSRDRDEDRGRGREDDRDGGRQSRGGSRGEDREDERGAGSRGRDEGRGRDSDDDGRGSSRGGSDRGRDRDDDRGGSRGSSRDEGRGSSRSRDDDDRFRN